jgi:chaperonin cofactor prefoldin
LKQFDLPTRSELNTVHKQMRELRERIATLEAQLAARGEERS